MKTIKEEQQMETLAKAGITVILPVKDRERAYRFYKETLGLKPGRVTAEGNQTFEGGQGTRISLLQKDEGTKAEHTALTFQIKDIEKVVEQLQEKGIAFEDYDLPGIKTINHICTIGSEKAAWFKDPEGNILCVHENLS
jgi:predicted enzyme related to lactoylglutathione lyase